MTVSAYLSWNSGVYCKNSRPGWFANKCLNMGRKSSMTIVFAPDLVNNSKRRYFGSFLWKSFASQKRSKIYLLTLGLLPIFGSPPGPYFSSILLKIISPKIFGILNMSVATYSNPSLPKLLVPIIAEAFPGPLPNTLFIASLNSATFFWSMGLPCGK